MTAQEALELVKQYQAWRRDDEEKYECPRNSHEAEIILLNYAEKHTETSKNTLKIMQDAITYFYNKNVMQQPFTALEYGKALDELIDKVEKSLK